MKPNAKTYLFIGEDSFKQEQINQILSKFLNPQNKDFNYDLVYASDLSKDFLKDILSKFPFGSDFRVLRVKDIDALPQVTKEILLAYFNKPLKSLVLILETNKAESKKDSFLNALIAKIDFSYSAKREDVINVFDLCKAIINKDTALALKFLNDLEVDAKNAHKILGGIIWQWEQMKFTMDSKELEQGFQVLYETDKSLKTGKMKAGLALEMLVMALSGNKVKSLIR